MTPSCAADYTNQVEVRGSDVVVREMVTYC